MIKKLFLLIFIVAILTGCGYKVSGKHSGLPNHVNIIAVPVFENKTKKFELSRIITRAVKTELIQQSDCRISAHAEEADAVLKGVITSYSVSPISITDQNVGTTFQILIAIQIIFKDQRRGTVIYSNPSYIIREEYTFSDTEVDFFLEEGPAMERAARAFAESLSATILENF